MPAREVLRFRDEAFHSYYTSPSYLDMVDRKFGPAAVEHVRRMTTVRLERDLLAGKMDVTPTLLPKAAPAPRREPTELLSLVRS